MNKIRTLLAHSDEKIINNIEGYVKNLNYIDVVGRAINGKETYTKIVELNPEVVFAQFDMPDMDGIEMIRQAKEKLNDDNKIPMFNLITENLSSSQIDEAYDLIGRKLNVQFENINEEKIVYIMEQYKEYKEYKNIK